MTDIVYTGMSVFIIAPWFALAPAALFGWFYRQRRSALALGAAGAWIGYGIYETGMALRWWCTGECNIRVDLLILYPLLLLLSGLAVVASFRTRDTR